jgi:integrase
MPRQAKLRQHKGQWCTNAGSRHGVYFGSVTDVPYPEAKRLFHEYLASLRPMSQQHQLPACAVATVCDDHLDWVKRHRSDALYRQRKCLLNQWCNHRVGELAGRRLPGHGEQVGRLRAHAITRQHVEEYLEYRGHTLCKQTGKPLGDKARRAIVIAVKACWNWAANTIEDGGGGLLSEDHRPLKKLPRGFVQLKDLTEDDLPTDQEIETLLRWATVDLSRIRAGTGRWRRRKPDEYFGNPDWRVFGDMLRVYHETGARTSELCDARVRDFMPRTGQICLGKHKRSRTQRKSAVRNIQISHAIHEILARNVQGKQSTDRLFTRGDGKPWDQSKVNRRMAAVRKAAAGRGQFIRPHITPYSFRDLYISELLMIGTPTFQVAKMAGTSMGEIERTYGHFFNQDLALAQARLVEVRHTRTNNATMPMINSKTIWEDNYQDLR